MPKTDTTHSRVGLGNPWSLHITIFMLCIRYIGNMRPIHQRVQHCRDTSTCYSELRSCKPQKQLPKWVCKASCFASLHTFGDSIPPWHYHTSWILCLRWLKWAMVANGKTKMLTTQLPKCYNASSLASPLAFLMPPILRHLVHTSAHCINQLKYIAHSNCCACMWHHILPIFNHVGMLELAIAAAL